MLFAASAESTLVLWALGIFLFLFMIGVAWKCLTDADFRKDWMQAEREIRESRQKKLDGLGRVVRMAMRRKL